MKRPTFLEGVVVALVAALLGSMAITVAPAIIGLDMTLRTVIAGLSLAYVLYLLRRSDDATGRIVTVSIWLLVSTTCWALISDPLLYLAVHIGQVWLVRALYHQPGPLAALADLGLNLLALAAGIWAFAHADSPFLGIWTFFLVQALFVAIPAADSRRTGTDEAAQSDRFQQAHRSAEAALRKLSTLQ